MFTNCTASAAKVNIKRDNGLYACTPQQKEVLMEFFLKNPYPSLKEKQMLARRLSRKVEQIGYWFSHQRMKERNPGNSGE